MTSNPFAARDLHLANQTALVLRQWPPGRSVATTQQLAEAGLGTRMLAEALRLGILHRLRRGVYVTMELWAGSPQWARSRLNLEAHIAGTPGVQTYTHFSAASLHQLPLWNDPGLIHINAPYQSSPGKSSRGVVVHHRNIDRAELVSLYIEGVGTVQLTSLLLTVMDCARKGPFAHAVILGDAALRRGLSREAVEHAIVTHMGRAGMRRARAVVAALDGRSESAGESRTRIIVAELPIEQPELQVTLQINGREYRPDFLWLRLRLILEFDGNTKYHDFQPTAEALILERERENALIEAGWRFIRVKWRDLDHPELLKARIMAAYRAAEDALGAR